jgi:hypothetical protein
MKIAVLEQAHADCSPAPVRAMRGAVLKAAAVVKVVSVVHVVQ